MNIKTCARTSMLLPIIIYWCSLYSVPIRKLSKITLRNITRFIITFVVDVVYMTSAYSKLNSIYHFELTWGRSKLAISLHSIWNYFFFFFFIINSLNCVYNFLCILYFTIFSFYECYICLCVCFVSMCKWEYVLKKSSSI